MEIYTYYSKIKTDLKICIYSYNLKNIKQACYILLITYITFKL